jgi:hypothetical protein
MRWWWLLAFGSLRWWLLSNFIIPLSFQSPLAATRYEKPCNKKLGDSENRDYLDDELKQLHIIKYNIKCEDV